MIIGYLDTGDKNIDTSLQRQKIIQYAAENNISVDIFFDGSNILTLTEKLKTFPHTVIVANVVALGASLSAISQNVSLLIQAGLTIISATEGHIISATEWDNLVVGVNFAIQIRYSLSSIMTRNALSLKKATGIKLGRKTPNKKRFLDGRLDEIKQKLALGTSKTQLAKDLGVSSGTLYSFLKQHPNILPNYKELP